MSRPQIVNLTLEDLGTSMAADPQFAQCATRRLYSYFHNVPISAVPFSEVMTLTATLTDNNMMNSCRT